MSKKDVKTIKILRREDGREFTYSPELDGLVRKGMLRLIEKRFENGVFADEVDLTKIDDDNTESMLREAIARKWPHLVELIDQPEIARMALKMAGGKDGKPSKVLLPGVKAGGTEIVPEPEADENGEPEADEQQADGEPDETPVEAQEPVDPLAAKIADFANAIRKTPSREGKQAFAAKHGIKIEQATAGAMVAEAVAKFEAMLKADKPEA
jgi:hypothetical protein